MRAAARLAATILLISAFCEASLPAVPTAYVAAAPAAPPSRACTGVCAHDFPITLYPATGSGGAPVEARVSTLMAGGKPLVLLFWAPLSRPSLRLLPAFQRAYQRYGTDVAFLALDVGEHMGLGAPEEASQVLRAGQLTFPAGGTPIAEVLIAYEVRGLPTILFIGADWGIQAHESAALRDDALLAMVAGLLDGTLPPPAGSVRACTVAGDGRARAG